MPAAMFHSGSSIDPNARRVRLDLLVRRRHELHEPTRADPASRVRVHLALGHRLRLEHAPVVADAEVALAVLAERLVVPIDVALCPASAATTRRADNEQDAQSDQRARSRQFSAPPMMIAMARNSAAMKIATATLPFLSSA